RVHKRHSRHPAGRHCRQTHRRSALACARTHMASYRQLRLLMLLAKARSRGVLRPGRSAAAPTAAIGAVSELATPGAGAVVGALSTVQRRLIGAAVAALVVLGAAGGLATLGGHGTERHPNPQF